MFCLGSAFLGHLQAMVMAELFQQVLKTPKYRANTFRLNFTCIHRCMYRSTIILNAYLHICECFIILLMEEFPNNHLRCTKPCK